MKEAVTWHALIPRPITESEDALAFVNACGFCTWGPVPRLSFPNLAEAMGETATSVLDRTWSWKDDLHFAQQLYYGKIIAGQPSFLAPYYLPDFISALAGRGLERERDVTRLYFDGLLSGEARAIYEWLLDHPVQPTRELRRGSRLGDPSKKLASSPRVGGIAASLPRLQIGSDGSNARHVFLRLGSGRALLASGLCRRPSYHAFGCP